MLLVRLKVAVVLLLWECCRAGFTTTTKARKSGATDSVRHIRGINREDDVLMGVLVLLLWCDPRIRTEDIGA